MVKRGTSIGFFGLFGRSEDLRRLDRALRQAGLHPALVPEGVKLAAVGLVAGERSDESSAGELMAFCALGEETFRGENGESAAAAAAGRLESAIEAGEGQDAEIVLLMLHAGLIHPQIVERYGIRAEESE